MTMTASVDDHVERELAALAELDRHGAPGTVAHGFFGGMRHHDHSQALMRKGIANDVQGLRRTVRIAGRTVKAAAKADRKSTLHPAPVAGCG